MEKAKIELIPSLREVAEQGGLRHTKFSNPFLSMKMKCLAIAGWLLASSLGLRAQVFEISPFYGYRFGGSIQTSSGQDSDIEAGPAYGLCLDYAPDAPDMKLQLFWSRQDSGLDLNGSAGLSHMALTVDEFMLGGSYENGRGRLTETLSVLVGATVFSPGQGEREARLGFGFGVGVKYRLLKNLALRADLRGYCTIVESDGVFISSGGVTVAYFTGSSIWQGEVFGGLTLSF
jgi:hypothetical protein